MAKLTSDGDLRLNSDVEAMNGFFSLRRSREGGGWLSLSASGYRLERGVPPESHVSEPRLWRYPLQSRVVTAFSAGSGFFATPWGQGDVEESVGLDLGRTERPPHGYAPGPMPRLTLDRHPGPRAAHA